MPRAKKTHFNSSVPEISGGGTVAGTIREVLKTVIDCFEPGNIPQTIAYSVFPRPDILSAGERESSQNQ